MTRQAVSGHHKNNEGRRNKTPERGAKSNPHRVKDRSDNSTYQDKGSHSKDSFLLTHIHALSSFFFMQDRRHVMVQPKLCFSFHRSGI